MPAKPILYVLCAFLAGSCAVLVLNTVVPFNSEEEDLVTLVRDLLPVLVALVAAVVGLAATQEATRVTRDATEVSRATSARDSDLYVREAVDGALSVYTHLLSGLGRAYVATISAETEFEEPLARLRERIKAIRGEIRSGRIGGDDAELSRAFDRAIDSIQLDSSDREYTMKRLADELDGVGEAYVRLRTNGFAWECFHRGRPPADELLKGFESDDLHGLFVVAADGLRKASGPRDLLLNLAKARVLSPQDDESTDAAQSTLIFLGTVLFPPVEERGFAGVAALLEIVERMSDQESFSACLRERFGSIKPVQEAAERFELTFRSENVVPTLVRGLREISVRYDLAARPGGERSDSVTVDA